MVFYASGHTGAHTLADFIAKARKDGVRLASGGNGTLTHLLAEVFAQAAQFRMTHVPYLGTGPAVPEAYDAGERVVVPALQALGVRRLDAIVVSHGDADHAGGFGAVQRRFAAPVVFTPQWDRVPGASPCLAGSRWEMDGVRFRFLHPDMHFPPFRNPSSCVLRVETAHGAALLPGDIDAVVERLLVRRDPQAFAADVVVAAHHGSRTSSDPAFVRASGARVVVMSAGHGSRFGHPHGEVVARWNEAGAAVGTTAGGGATRLRLQAGGVVVTQQRTWRPRLWDAVQQADARAARAGAAAQAGLSYSPD